MNIKIPALKDLPFYEVLHFSEYMNTILITGNKKHFPCEEFILTPSEYSKKFYP